MPSVSCETVRACVSALSAAAAKESASTVKAVFMCSSRTQKAESPANCSARDSARSHPGMHLARGPNPRTGQVELSAQRRGACGRCQWRPGGGPEFLENLPRVGEEPGWRIREWLGPKMREQLTRLPAGITLDPSGS